MDSAFVVLDRTKDLFFQKLYILCSITGMYCRFMIGSMVIHFFVITYATTDLTIVNLVIVCCW